MVPNIHLTRAAVSFLFISLLVSFFGNRSKTPDKKSPRPKHPDNKTPRIIEKIIVKYAVDANLFRLGSTNPKKKSRPLDFFISKKEKNVNFFSSKMLEYF